MDVNIIIVSMRRQLVRSPEKMCRLMPARHLFRSPQELIAPYRIPRRRVSEAVRCRHSSGDNENHVHLDSSNFEFGLCHLCPALLIYR